MHHRSCALAAVAATALLGLPPSALAQGSAPRADPADPKAPAAPLAHRSAFADYKPYQDIAPGDWRRLNDTVGRAALPSSGPAPTTATPQPPTKGGRP